MRQFSAICLVLFCSASYAQSESEPNDNSAQANVVPSGATVAGDIGCGNNSVDFFSITQPGNGRLDLTVTASNTGTPGSIQVQVFNSSGGLVANNTVASGAAQVLQNECFGAGLYFVQIYTNTGDCYSYSLSWALMQPGFGNDAEPDNNSGQALLLPVNTDATGHVGFLNYGDNEDWYQFTTADDGRTTVTCDAYALGNGGESGAQLQVFNGDGGLLDNWSCDVGSSSAIAHTDHILDCRAAGLYYLRIYANAPCGVAYSVRHGSTTPFYMNDLEPNNNSGEADTHPAIDPGADIDGHVAFASYGDNADFYRIVSPDQGVITFTTIAESQGGADATGLQVQLFNSGGGLLENWSVAVGGGALPDTSTVSTYCKGSGTYYLAVYANAPCGVSYRLRFNGIAPIYANDTEDNDNAAQAIAIDYNTNAEGRLAFNYDDNDDWFAITPPDQGVIHIEVMAEHVGAADATGLQVQFFSTDGGLLENWSVAVGAEGMSATTTVSTTCKGTGTYFVRLYANAPCGVSYSWRYSGTAPVYANDEEDNDDTGQAVPVAFDTPAQGRLSFYYDDNSDFYRIDPPDQGVIHIAVMAENVGTADAAGLQVQLFNDGGGLLNNWSVAVGGELVPDTTVVSTTCKGTGTYFIRFYANAPCGVSYTWRYTGTAPVFGNDVEDNDNAGQADTISYNTAADGRLAFYYDDNDDWYAVTPDDESIIHIEVSAEHIGDADAAGLQVQFFNSDGGLLENWSVPVGGGSVPEAMTIDTYCRGEGLYYVRFYANNPCGVSYSWKYTATDPAFAADAEPDNNTTQAIPLSLANWWQDGRLSFYYGDNDDWYAFDMGVEENLVVNTSAESPGDVGSMQVQIFNSGGGLIGNQSVDVGANGVSVEDVADFGLYPAASYFLRVYSNGLCGVSYRLLCHDLDGDGICDGTALGTSVAVVPGELLTARPNPSGDGLFRISSPFVPAWIEVRDIQGQLIGAEQNVFGRQWSLDLSRQPAGVYSIRVGDASGHATTTRLVRY